MRRLPMQHFSLQVHVLLIDHVMINEQGDNLDCCSGALGRHPRTHDVTKLLS